MDIGIKLAKAFGATVFATAQQKCSAIRRFGADYAINYREEDFAKVCHDQTTGRGVDIVVDIVAATICPVKWVISAWWSTGDH